MIKQKNTTPYTHIKLPIKGIYGILKAKKGQTLFEALWNSGCFTSKTALNRLFEQGAIKYHD